MWKLALQSLLDFFLKASRVGTAVIKVFKYKQVAINKVHFLWVFQSSSVGQDS